MAKNRAMSKAKAKTGRGDAPARERLTPEQHQFRHMVNSRGLFVLFERNKKPAIVYNRQTGRELGRYYFSGRSVLAGGRSIKTERFDEALDFILENG